MRVRPFLLLGLAAFGLSRTPLARADDDPKALLIEGKTFEDAADWAKAREVYAKLEKHKTYVAEALYREALAAFQDNDNTGAQLLAERAAKTAGPYRVEAMVLYGDTIFRNGEYARAKAIYVGVRARATASRRVVVTKKIRVCNRKLDLPEDDGLDGAPATDTPPPPPVVTPPVRPAHPETGDAVFAQARAAFGNLDTDAALALAMKAVKLGGPHRRDAQFLYGDVLFVRADYERAKDVYIALRKQTTGDLRAMATRKVMACNRALSLPERDAVDDD